MADPSAGFGPVANSQVTRRLYILTNAGKPIWSSTNEEEEVLAPLMGLITAVVGFTEREEDHLQALVAGKTRIVLLTRGALVLLAVSALQDTEAYLSLLLETLYFQILFVLTSRVHKVLETSSSYDLRNLLGGTESFLAGLTHQALTDAGILTGAVRSLRIDPALREEAGRILTTAQHEEPEILYAILLVGNRVLTMLQPKHMEHQVHTTDLLLIINFITRNETFRQTESWTPLCLPRFNASGFLYSYVGYVDEATDLCLLLVSTNQKPQTFHHFQQWKVAVTAALHRDDTLISIKSAQASEAQKRCESLVRTPGESLRHFVYVHRTSPHASAPNQSTHSSSSALNGSLNGSLNGVSTSATTASQNMSSTLRGVAQSGHHSSSSHHNNQSTMRGVTQYLCSAFDEFPYDSEDSRQRVLASYQRSALRLRYATTSAEETLQTYPVTGSSSHNDKQSVFDVWEKAPENGIVQHSMDCALTIGVAGNDFELHATFPTSVLATEALVECQSLIQRIKRQADWLFYTKVLTY